MTTDSPNLIPLGPINYNCILIKLLQIQCITAEKVLFNDHHYGTGINCTLHGMDSTGFC